MKMNGFAADTMMLGAFGRPDDRKELSTRDLGPIESPPPPKVRTRQGAPALSIQPQSASVAAPGDARVAEGINHALIGIRQLQKAVASIQAQVDALANDHRAIAASAAQANSSVVTLADNASAALDTMDATLKQHADAITELIRGVTGTFTPRRTTKPGATRTKVVSAPVVASHSQPTTADQPVEPDAKEFQGWATYGAGD